MWQLNRNVQNNDSGLSTFKVSANLFYITLVYYITNQYILLSTNNRGFKRFFSLDEDMYSVHCKKVLLHKRNILTHFERFINLVFGTAYLYQVIRCLSLHKNDTRNLRKLFLWLYLYMLKSSTYKRIYIHSKLYVQMTPLIIHLSKQ